MPLAAPFDLSGAAFRFAPPLRCAGASVVRACLPPVGRAQRFVQRAHSCTRVLVAPASLIGSELPSLQLYEAPASIMLPLAALLYPLGAAFALPRPFPFLSFTGVRGIGFLRTSPFWDSRKFLRALALCAEAHTSPSYRSMLQLLRGQLTPREGAGQLPALL
jgi:hypothetical protein